MSDTNNPFYTNEEWVRYYQETPVNPTAPVSGGGTTMLTGFTSDNVSCSSIISGGGGGGSGSGINSSNSSPQLSPLKPVRRRSRASKRTPVMLLNASATNFRALVQQFTGCPQATGGALLGRQKGPVNLSFGRNDYDELTESSKSMYSSYDQQGLTQSLPQPPHGRFSEYPTRNGMESGGVDNNMFGETTSQENGFIDESSSLNGRSSNGGYFF